MIEVRPLEHGDTRAAIELLTGAFSADPGIVAILGNRLDRLDHWFVATSRLLAGSGGGCLAAYDGTIVRGVLLHATGRTSHALPQLAWAASVAKQIGLGPVVRTAAHDRVRRKAIPEEAHIVEFVAVDSAQRGEGIGRRMFEALQRTYPTTWLETTRPENLPIFTRLGYCQEDTRDESGVAYISMIRNHRQ